MGKTRYLWSTPNVMKCRRLNLDTAVQPMAVYAAISIPAQLCVTRYSYIGWTVGCCDALAE
jgi:hypothetical protein